MKKEDLEDGWHSFLKICQKMKSPKDLDALFNFFFTIEEKNNFATRALVVRSLLKGKKTQREIADDYSLSLTKITRGSNALKIITDKLKDNLAKSL